MRKRRESKREVIFETVRKLLKEAPGGVLRYSELVRKIREAHPDIKENTIYGALYNLIEKIKSGKIRDIDKPDKGIFKLVDISSVQQSVVEEKQKIREEDLYELFANYLVNELEECTNAIALGGKIFEDKWGTPDVLGIYKFPDYEPIKLPIPEVVSAEIKADSNQLIVAFGQACAYKLFSHKVYLVVPNQQSGDIARLESLCIRFGLGLILYEIIDNKPEFRIRARAIKSEPDYFYLNQYLNKLKLKNHQSFKKLFG